MDIRQTLINVINTLNLLPTNGKTNMDRLLGSIVALEKCVDALDAQAVKPEAGPKEATDE